MLMMVFSSECRFVKLCAVILCHAEKMIPHIAGMLGCLFLLCIFHVLWIVYRAISFVLFLLCFACCYQILLPVWQCQTRCFFAQSDKGRIVLLQIYPDFRLKICVSVLRKKKKHK